MLFFSTSTSADILLSLKESWTSGNIADWTHADPPAPFVFSFSAVPPDGHGLAGLFGEQSLLLPASDAFVADAASSSGRFAGNYHVHDLIPDSIRFDFFADTVLPSALLLRLHGVAGGATNTYFASLLDQISSAGEWTQVVVPLTEIPGLWQGGTPWPLEDALEQVQSLELWVVRRGNAEQSYLLDNFQVVLLVPPDVAELDTDGDGLPDYWERAVSGSITGVVAHVDTDDDGYPDGAEFDAGTDPGDPKSVPRIVALHPIGDALWEAWVNGTLGRNYRLEWNNNLMTDNWVPISHGVPGTGGYTQLPYPDPSRRGFVRMRVYLAPVSAAGEPPPYFITRFALTPTEADVAADYDAGHFYSLWHSSADLPHLWYPVAAPPVYTNAAVLHFMAPRLSAEQQIYRVHRYAP